MIALLEKGVARRHCSLLVQTQISPIHVYCLVLLCLPYYPVVMHRIIQEKERKKKQ